jgi:hypothetical protein
LQSLCNRCHENRKRQLGKLLSVIDGVSS